MSRNFSLDGIKVILTALVIFHHTAIVYGGSGGWYYKELPDASIIFLVMFNATNQSYFMGFFFLIAGYFTPESLAKKGNKAFLKDRFIRLGIPWLFYFFVLAPLTVALMKIADGNAFFPTWWQMILERDFHPGPLWFTQTLLIFSLVLLLWYKIHPTLFQKNRNFPKPLTLLCIAVFLGAINFLIRLYIPVGKNYYWMQLAYFPCYIFLFFAGCFAWESKLLEKIQYQKTWYWVALSLILIIFLYQVVKSPFAGGKFHGGFNLDALTYAIWDPLTACGFILFYLWFFNRFLSHKNILTNFLAKRAYGAYIVHPPILVFISVFLAHWQAQGIVKFFAVASISCILSFLICSILLLIPKAKRVL